MPAPQISITGASASGVGQITVSGHLVHSLVSNKEANATCGVVIAPRPGQGLPGTDTPTVGGPGCLSNQDPTAHKVGVNPDWSRSIGGLAAGTDYACRVWATNAAGGPTYSGSLFVTTWNVPGVALGALSGIDRDSAVGGGNVVRDGGSAVFRRGVVWDLASNPMPTMSGFGTPTGSAHSSDAASGGVGAFSANMASPPLNTAPYAPPGKTYRYRAWAINSVGLAHSQSALTWTTNTIPSASQTVPTNVMLDSTFTAGQADLHGSCSDGVGDGANQAVTDKGFEYIDASFGITDPASSSGSMVPVSLGGGAGALSATVHGLTPGHSYYVWAYARNSVGTAYSARFTIVVPTVTSLVCTPAEFKFRNGATITTTNAWMLQAYPWNEFNNRRHALNDPAVRFNQRVDWDHPVPHFATVRLVPVLSAIVTPVYAACTDAVLRPAAAARFCSTKDYGADLSQRAFHLATSFLGVEPLLKQPPLVDPADGRTHRADGGVLALEPVVPPPPPPPPPPPDTEPPAAPTRFFVATDTHNAIMSWDLNVEPDVVAYRIYQLVGSSWTRVKSVAHPTHGATVGGLTSGTAYQFRITAVDSSGNESDPSKVAHVSTLQAANVVTVPIGDASDTFASTGKFDATGTRDISDELIAWLNNNQNVPNGTGAAQATRVIFPKTRNGIRARYRIEGGVNGGLRPQGMTDVAFDGQAPAGAIGGGGALLVSTTKHPFLAASANNPSANPNGDWDEVYTPTNTIVTTFTGNPAPYATVQAKATDFAATDNRSRSMWRPRNCTRLAFRNMQMTGSYNNSGYDPLFEAQDGIDFEGCVDVEVGNVTIDHMWGNGIECTPLISGNTWTPTTGLWVHDSDVEWFGRQAFTLMYGQRFIIEDTTFGHAHTGMDCEPQSNQHNLEGDASITDVHVLDCTITDNGSGGAFAFHAGVLRVHVAGNTGSRPGLAAECFAERVIFENNKDTDTSGTNVGPYGSHYGRIAAADDNNATGVDYGGRFIIHRNNTLIAHLGSAKFENGCDDYSSSGNTTHDSNAQTRGQVPVGDAASSNPPSFTLPPPAHALRDL